MFDTPPALGGAMFTTGTPLGPTPTTGRCPATLRSTVMGNVCAQAREGTTWVSRTRLAIARRRKVMMNKNSRYMEPGKVTGNLWKNYDTI
ncbi:hypothetical protein BRI6_2532 [plant metagenome]|uniref:Uncharacterized protein n=1 Tax=plant metagenome TaxID=1297885 RepID=A0A484RUW3_9ZZZZ